MTRDSRLRTEEGVFVCDIGRVFRFKIEYFYVASDLGRKMEYLCVT